MNDSQQKRIVRGFGQRLKEVMDALNMNQSQFARKIGVDPSYINKMVKRDLYPDDKILRLICIESHARHSWLETGKGPKHELRPSPDKGIEYPNLSTDAQYVSAHGRPHYGEDRRKEQRRKGEREKDVEDRVLIVERHLHQLEEKFIKLDKENKDLRAQCVKHERAPGHFGASRKEGEM